MPKLASSLKNFKKYGRSQGTEMKYNAMISTKEYMKKALVPPPKLTLPFPPQINAEDLIDTKTRKLPSKPPNAFFIYRKVYTKELVAQNFRFKMTDVSPLVSTSWKLESDEVKTKYKEIARDVRQIYKKKKNSIEEVEDSSDDATSKNDDLPKTNPKKSTADSFSSSSNQKKQTETVSPLVSEGLLSTPDIPKEDGLFEQWAHTDFTDSNFLPHQSFIEFEGNSNSENAAWQSNSSHGTEPFPVYPDYANYSFAYHHQIDQLFAEPWAHEWSLLLDLSIPNVDNNQF
ncbi:14775_t:CDS:1 [Acaulospora colombiana]|uniref:14775_t:CDS:1 n=1 Tax=Acaulospora colombiana TaxID=27376 RepID=A0ACA9MZV7_9GLOM|nr:14775_t:CDS:1 [Acaulospora colombiana]